MGRGGAGSEPHGESPLVSACPWVLAHSHSDSASSSHSPKEYARHTDSPACKPGRWPRPASHSLPTPAREMLSLPVWMMTCSVTGDSACWLVSPAVLSPDGQASLCWERPSELLLSCTQFIVSARSYFRVREFATRRVFGNWLCTA